MTLDIKVYEHYMSQRLTSFPGSTILAPIQCACSNSQQHETDHVECQCDGWYRLREGLTTKYPEFYTNAWHCLVVIGRYQWQLCRFCQKVMDFPRYLSVCPTCDKKFVGYRPFPKIEMECEQCENL